MGKFTIFARIAEVEFSEIVVSSQEFNGKLRIHLIDKSFIDFFYSSKKQIQGFAVHWQRQDGTIYRIDNTPDKKWRKVPSFPIHFHYETYGVVVKPPFKIKQKYKLENIVRDFLTFARERIA